ncbi:restriction endonuclease subunit S [Marinobacter halophilus]|uniref:restriction endonuclease subunit S n=1 Tax=Marinobacter halophilus TaxID=1323740 RepID=UPI001994E918|nr:restriction endonuclease subunit S [Marinobacter halophilus]GGC66825.1 type I restriction endonuclease EcoKI subunit S [Marinobacter halophilus]
MKETDHAPANWARCSLADIVVLNPKNDASAEQAAGFVPMALAPTDYHGTLLHEEKLWGEIKKSYTNFADGDVIFAKVTPCFENGKAAIVRDMPSGIGAGSSEFYVLRPASKEISPSLLFAIIKTKSFMQQGAENMTGAVGLRRVPRAFVESFPIALPSAAEQKAIADKLDTLLAQVENTKARLERIPQILKRFRQSVLAAAVSGRLTEEWRSTSELNGWANITLGDLVQSIEAGKNLKCIETPPGEDECGIIKISAVTWGVYDEEQSKTLPEKNLFLESRRIKVGDFLISRANTIELLGNPVIVHAVTKNLMLSDKVLRLNMDDEDKAWVNIFLRSMPGRREIQDRSTGNQMSMRNIGQKALLEIPIPKPPSEEQTEIILRVDQLFAHADRIEQQVNNALARVNNLTQSILAKAFRGELTEQWRKDNPELISGENSAEALLERVRAERATVASKSRRRNAKA